LPWPTPCPQSLRAGPRSNALVHVWNEACSRFSVAMNTTENLKANLEKDLADLARMRDEIRVKVHLAGLDAKSAWKSLEPRFDELERDVREEGAVVKSASLLLAKDLKSAFEQFRSRLG